MFAKVSPEVEVVEVVNLVNVDEAEVRVVEDFDAVDDVEDATDRFVFVAVTVTTVGNFAEQKLAASGTPARGFKRA